MIDTISDFVPAHQAIVSASAELGFSMNVDAQAASLLRTLAATKPGGRFLELGTGTGLSTAWILSGMDERATLISVDNDAACLAVASQFLGSDSRLQLVCQDGTEWVTSNTGPFDFIFADTWAGKYTDLDAVLSMLAPGGLYIIDDMLPQPNWPDGHAEKADRLTNELMQRTDLLLTRMAWSTGLIIATRKG
ncbi:MAG: methyltransferase domain-containing protein [Cytophagaceae bacterium]|nr:MAG: methyltransferase domain-containing protein [Cytophagaceae bacterium]